ncbi:ATP-binding protein [Kitasatospora sp. NPDC088346]|uniref:ATP-binding protein n=1 Tax=Kitasatospora sp. NPDC088346 TaxID=3364073 RepID=UPI0038074D51
MNGSARNDSARNDGARNDGARYGGAPNDGHPKGRAAVCSLPVTPAADADMRHFAAQTARRWRIPPEVVEALCGVVTELVGNVVVHSGSPEVTVLLTQRAGCLTLQVKDLGRWRRRPAPRHLTADAGPAHGRGLRLVRQATSCRLAVLAPTGTRVVARFAVAAGGPA